MTHERLAESPMVDALKRYRPDLHNWPNLKPCMQEDPQGDWIEIHQYAEACKRIEQLERDLAEKSSFCIALQDRAAAAESDMEAAEKALAEAFERCAKMCEERAADRERFLGRGGEYWDGYTSMAEECAAALRALKDDSKKS